MFRLARHYCRNADASDRSLTRDQTYLECDKEANIVRDIYEVLHKKQAEQAQLGKQIEALQTAAEQLRGVAHLLDDDHEEQRAAAGRG